MTHDGTRIRPDPPVTILCVCTGNICRSPVAERLLADRLGRAVVVSSAGTHALVGQPIWEPMGRLVQGDGANVHGFAARQLDEPLLRDVELTLAMSQEHRAATANMWPKGIRHAFTLKEFARLLDTIAPGELPDRSAAARLRTAIRLASQRRQPAPHPTADDVGDPYLEAPDVRLTAFGEIREAVNRIAAAVRSIG